MLRAELKNISIYDLLKKRVISIKTYKCCYNSKLHSLLDIIKLYESSRSFEEIVNAGTRTYFELESLCKQYLPMIELSDNINNIKVEEKFLKRETDIDNLTNKHILSALQNNKVDGADILRYLNSNQKSIFETTYNSLIKNYSNRTTNRLKTIGYEHFVVSYLFDDDTTLFKIRGLGRKSIKEAIDFKQRLKSSLFDLISFSKKELLKLYFFQQTDDPVLHDHLVRFFDKNNHFPMFWMLEQHFYRDATRDIKILTDWFPVFQNHRKTSLAEIAKKHNLTTERVRQIRNNVFQKNLNITDKHNDIKNKKHVIKCFELLQNKDLWAYSKEMIKESHVVNKAPDDINKCLRIEDCTFSVEFVMHLISFLFRDRYRIIGDDRFTLKNAQQWKAMYLIRKELCDVFDFVLMKNNFCETMLDNECDYQLNINEYITNSNFWIDFNLSKIDEIKNVVRSVLLHEYGLYSDGDNDLYTIPAQKTRNICDILYDILKQNGKPMHLNDIFIEFKKLQPEHKYSEPENIRPWLYRHDLIASRNRNSTYMLKEWRHIRKGTIRDAIIMYLEDNDSPQTAEDITAYVLKYFPETNLNSVRTSMINDTQNRFSVFKNRLFGLAYKEYLSITCCAIDF